MGDINLLAVFIAALAFCVIGALWYGPLFGRAWRRLAGVSKGTLRNGSRNAHYRNWLIMLLGFAFALLISLTLAHQYAMTAPSVRARMMIAIGYGAMLMAPALGIAYLLQRRPGKLFAIDAGYFIVGMAAMGAVHSLID